MIDVNRASIRLQLAICAAVVMTLPVSAQRQVAKVLASNATPGDQFGASTGIDGDWAVIGAPLNSDRAFKAGAAYVFHRANGTWSETQELLASDGASPDEFGRAVAMSGDTIVIGAYVDTTPSGLHTGSVYVFERAGLLWFETAKLVASDAGSDALFGSAVAISGDRIAVGAWNAGSAGKVYVFERVGATWQQAAILVQSDAISGDSFGTAVAIDGDRLVGGAPFAFLPMPQRKGAAYVFQRNTQGLWIQQQKLIASDGAHNDFFGYPVAIFGDHIGVGALSHNSERGASYFFTFNSSVWTQSSEFQPPDAVSGTHSGVWALHGDTAVTSIDFEADAGTYAGGGHVVQHVGSPWVQSAKFIPNDSQAGDYAYAASFSGTTVLLGAPSFADGCPNVPCAIGKAYFFELAPTTIQYGSCLTGSPCSNNDGHGGCRNSTGQGAILQASGSGSVTTDDLVMEVRHLPPFAPGLIFMGGAQTTTPFGSGQLVVADDGRGIYRIEIHFSDADGVFLHGPGNVALTQGIPNPLGHITAGDTWNFQCWYRDQQGPCGTGFNLTNGLQVSYVP